jgi:hypothetical protein
MATEVNKNRKFSNRKQLFRRKLKVTDDTLKQNLAIKVNNIITAIKNKHL